LHKFHLCNKFDGVKKIFLIACLKLLLINFIEAQFAIFKEKNQTEYFFLGGSLNLSSVNIFRNYIENPYHLGWSIRASYLSKKNFRITTEYFRTPKFQLSPTWNDVRSNNLVVSFNALANIVDQDVIIYTVSGICFQSWKGFYTGLNDFSDARFYYKKNSWVINKIICMDLGIGFEKPFPGFNLYGDFRYRFADIDKRFGIIDAFYQLGIHFPLSFYSVEKKIKPRRKRKLFNSLHDKYSWF
jgi:hypothetical protein